MGESNKFDLGNNLRYRSVVIFGNVIFSLAELLPNCFVSIQLPSPPANPKGRGCRLRGGRVLGGRGKMAATPLGVLAVGGIPWLAVGTEPHRVVEIAKNIKDKPVIKKKKKLSWPIKFMKRNTRRKGQKISKYFQVSKKIHFYQFFSPINHSYIFPPFNHSVPPPTSLKPQSLQYAMQRLLPTAIPWLKGGHSFTHRGGGVRKWRTSIF